jgi:hypothetical protein
LIEVHGFNTAYPGLIPPVRNTIVLGNQDKDILLPFRKERVVFGKVSIVADSYAGTKFSPDNVLVKAVDSTGKKFSTLTDSIGAFSLSLPAGRYTVSLNEEAFKGALRPMQASFIVDISMDFSSEVNFTLVQRKREIRMRK